MRTIAIEVGVAEHIFAHQICSMRFDNALKKIEICMANKKEYTLSPATIDGYRDIIRKLVIAVNSPQPVIISGFDREAIYGPEAKAKMEEPAADKTPALCAACGTNPATIDGVCDSCMEASMAEPQSFDGLVQ